MRYADAGPGNADGEAVVDGDVLAEELSDLAGHLKTGRRGGIGGRGLAGLACGGSCLRR